jgi:hypothetical protein
MQVRHECGGVGKEEKHLEGDKGIPVLDPGLQELSLEILLLFVQVKNIKLGLQVQGPEFKLQRCVCECVCVCVCVCVCLYVCV